MPRPLNSPRLSFASSPVLLAHKLQVELEETGDLSFTLPIQKLPSCSPLLLPRKRTLEPDDAGDFCFALPTRKLPSCGEQPAKQPKVELQRNVQILDEMALASAKEHCSNEVAANTAVQPTALQKLPSLRGPRPNCALDAAVAEAMRLHREAITEYALEKDMRGEDKADKFAEKFAAEHYQAYKNAILALLPWTGEAKAAAGGRYDMLRFCGHKTKRLDVSKRQLQHFRAEGAQARAWEALCAVLAAISSRKDKVWLEGNDILAELKPLLRKIPLCKSKRSATRRAQMRKLIPKLLEEGRGAFAESLIDPRSVHQVTFARGLASPLPASSMIYRRMSLWDALKTMDDEGPLRAEAFEKQWVHGHGRQFALQDLEMGHKVRSRKERVHANYLEPDTQLRDLLRNNRPVILLDSLAALAPRDVARENGFSEIVKAEMATLFREAKARGEAVVFCLGTEFPHMLAQKVYLRPPLADHGMRCGCLRWRASAEVPWRREFKWEDRITLGLQMP